MDLDSFGLDPFETADHDLDALGEGTHVENGIGDEVLDELQVDEEHLQSGRPLETQDQCQHLSLGLVSTYHFIVVRVEETIELEVADELANGGEDPPADHIDSFLKLTHLILSH